MNKVDDEWQSGAHLYRCPKRMKGELKSDQITANIGENILGIADRYGILDKVSNTPA